MNEDPLVERSEATVMSAEEATGPELPKPLGTFVRSGLFRKPDAAEEGRTLQLVEGGAPDATPREGQMQGNRLGCAASAGMIRWARVPQAAQALAGADLPGRLGDGRPVRLGQDRLRGAR